MPSVTTSSLPIDRDSVEELKEKLLGLQVENGNNELFGNEGFPENGDAKSDEGIFNLDEEDSTLSEVAILLDGMGMRKYINTFKQEDIDLNTFLNLTEKDLEELGISSGKDRKIIIKNVGEHKEPVANEYVIPENHSDDFQITKNIQSHLLLVQSYSALVECQMKRSEFVDYDITSKDTGRTFFTEFTKAALKQTELISNLLYQHNSSNHLIGMILKANELVLPDDLQGKLISGKSQKRRNSIRLVGFVGLSVVLIYAAKKLLKRIIN